MTPQNIARVAHEANRAYCTVLGDASQLPWESAPDWQQQSAINGVNFHLANPGSLPSASHENWLKEKLEQGWTYGPVKDPDKKIHPCIMPYDGLPLVQQIKDALFIAIVHALERTK